MESPTTFICQLEALPEESAEFCMGGVCCGIYKRQSVGLLYFLWILFLVLVVSPALYYIFIHPHSQASNNEQRNDIGSIKRLHRNERICEDILLKNRKQNSNESENRSRVSGQDKSMNPTKDEIRPKNHKEQTKKSFDNAREEENVRREEERRSVTGNFKIPSTADATEDPTQPECVSNDFSTKAANDQRVSVISLNNLINPKDDNKPKGENKPKVNEMNLIQNDNVSSNDNLSSNDVKSLQSENGLSINSDKLSHRHSSEDKDDNLREEMTLGDNIPNEKYNKRESKNSLTLNKSSNDEFSFEPNDKSSIQQDLPDDLENKNITKGGLDDELEAGHVTKDGLGDELEAGHVTKEGLDDELEAGHVTKDGLDDELEAGHVTKEGLDDELEAGHVTKDGLDDELEAGHVTKEGLDDELEAGHVTKDGLDDELEAGHVTNDGLDDELEAGHVSNQISNDNEYSRLSKNESSKESVIEKKDYDHNTPNIERSNDEEYTKRDSRVSNISKRRFSLKNKFNSNKEDTDTQEPEKASRTNKKKLSLKLNSFVKTDSKKD
ncbi:uncharacterized protein LOC129001652 [Macrosteles quadrilineatus]|uniref:uncharacterized protein LOC129001652 n=1 Tax=Macrosteles quadrilineatus TaxID=74068 RepID=UPI0023E0F382|nr:uncharacterized protein LOC129001652 [Macrosteles quadrilineatus]